MVAILGASSSLALFVVGAADMVFAATAVVYLLRRMRLRWFLGYPSASLITLVRYSPS